jgi:hypothetical protein
MHSRQRVTSAAGTWSGVRARLATAAAAAPTSSPAISLSWSYCPVFAHKRDNRSTCTMVEDTECFGWPDDAAAFGGWRGQLAPG